MKYHLACGSKHLDGFVNVDIRHTKAADISSNCIGLGFIGNNTASLLFANAFLEHMKYSEIDVFMESAKRVLTEDGVLCVTGIPDAHEYCKAYRECKIDIKQLYGLTHGAPERKHTEDYYSQLHKSLFDIGLLHKILVTSEWKWVTYLLHGYAGDPVDWHLGFICGNGKQCSWQVIEQLVTKTYGQEIRNVATR